MNVDIIKEQIIALKKLKTPNSEFIVNLFEYYLKMQNFKKVILDSDFVTVVNKNYNIDDVIKINKYIPNKLIIDNSTIYINLNNYEIGENWFYNSQNNLCRIYSNLLKIKSEVLTEKILIDKVLDIKNNDYTKKYVVDSKKYKLYKLIKNLDKIITSSNLKNIKFLIEYEEEDILKYNFVLMELKVALEVIRENDYKKKITYLYDYFSDYLDKEFKNYNFCNFKNNQCFAQYDKNNNFKFPYTDYNGCCYDVRNKVQCYNLDTASCDKCKIKSLSCKLLICSYLRSKGINYSIYDSLLTKSFLKLQQKLDCVWEFYIDEKEMIKRIEKANISKHKILL